MFMHNLLQMRSLTFTMQEGALCKYWIYITEQIGHHIWNIAHTEIMVNGHTDLIFLHIYAKSQPAKTSTSHIIAKFVLKIYLKKAYKPDLPNI